jgi:hypothetical protein
MHRLFALAMLELWRREFRVMSVGESRVAEKELLPII